MPRAASGFAIRFCFGRPSRSSSAFIAASPGAQTTAICSTLCPLQALIKCPMIVVFPHGKSIFGLPMREEAPAASKTTATRKDDDGFAIYDGFVIFDYHFLQFESYSHKICMNSGVNGR